MSNYQMLKCPCCSLVGPTELMKPHVERCVNAYRLTKQREQKKVVTGAS
jgi:hypothetical protein